MEAKNSLRASAGHARNVGRLLGRVATPRRLCTAGLVFFAAFGRELSPAYASTATTTFTVTATVQSNCLVTATNLAFGTYTGVVNNATSSLSVTCTNTTTYNVGLNAGTFSGATVTSRKMTGSGSASLAYALYSNAGMTTNWGQTVGTDTVSGTGTGAAQPLTVYGQIAASQYPTPGAYTDTITVTITY